MTKKKENTEKRDYMGEACAYLLYMQRIDPKEAEGIRKMQQNGDRDGIIDELDGAAKYISSLKRGLRKQTE